MKITALEYFITLAESRSINEAAKKLYIAQPSLTKALKLFEKEIGVQLFYRSKKGIVLTAAGERILPEAKKMVEYYRGWLRLSEPDVLHSINVYCHTSLAGFLIPDIILKFKELYPEIPVNYMTNPTPELYISDEKQDPVISLTLCKEGEEYDKLVKRQGNSPLNLLQGEYVCLVSRNSSLAKKKKVNIEDLKDFYCVLTHIDSLIKGTSVLSPVLLKIVDTVSFKKIIQMEHTSNVIELIQRNPEVFALSYYPILNRYRGVAEKELTYIPFENHMAKCNLCLFYSEQAYRQYPLVK